MTAGYEARTKCLKSHPVIDVDLDARTKGRAVNKKNIITIKNKYIFFDS